MFVRNSPLDELSASIRFLCVSTAAIASKMASSPSLQVVRREERRRVTCGRAIVGFALVTIAALGASPALRTLTDLAVDNCRLEPKGLKALLAGLPTAGPRLRRPLAASPPDLMGRCPVGSRRRSLCGWSETMSYSS